MMRHYKIIFDGGLNNYKDGKGTGYGSYVIEDLAPDETVKAGYLPLNLKISRFDFEEIMTNNVSEYSTLNLALDRVLNLSSSGKNTKVTILGDSELVRKQVGTISNNVWYGWKVNYPELQNLRDIIRKKLEQLEYGFEYYHVERKFIVSVLGH